MPSTSRARTAAQGLGFWEARGSSASYQYIGLVPIPGETRDPLLGKLGDLHHHKPILWRELTGVTVGNRVLVREDLPRCTVREATDRLKLCYQIEVVVILQLQIADNRDLRDLAVAKVKSPDHPEQDKVPVRHCVHMGIR